MRNSTQSIRSAAWMGALALLLAGWASAGDLPASGPAPEPAVGAEGRLTIDAVALAQQERGAELTVTTRGALVWTTYRNADDELVLELPGSVAAEAVGDLYAAEGLVESVTVERADGVTRLMIATRIEAEHSVAAEGSLLRLQLFPAGAAAVETAETPVTEAAPEPAASIVA
ncbi:MAG: AMIN domain-containing protein, partial [Thermoanaerobaculia bacterium]